FEWPRSRARMCIGTGRDTVPGTAALFCGVGPPESACVLGAVRLGLWCQEPRLLLIAKPGRAGAVLRHGCCHPGADAKQRHRSREGELLSLDFESLMCVRPGDIRIFSDRGEGRPTLYGACACACLRGPPRTPYGSR